MCNCRDCCIARSEKFEEPWDHDRVAREFGLYTEGVYLGDGVDVEVWRYGDVVLKEFVIEPRVEPYRHVQRRQLRGLCRGFARVHAIRKVGPRWYVVQEYVTPLKRLGRSDESPRNGAGLDIVTPEHVGHPNKFVAAIARACAEASWSQVRDCHSSNIGVRADGTPAMFDLGQGLHTMNVVPDRLFAVRSVLGSLARAA